MSPASRYPRREHRQRGPRVFSIDYRRSPTPAGRCSTGFATLCWHAAEDLKNDTH
jgi:hypothetical protein